MKKPRKIIAVLLTIVMLFSTMFQVAFASTSSAFSDTKGHWAEARILKWADWGIIQGSAGKFRPDSGMTNAEFCSVINGLFGFTEKSETNFSDVKSGSWYMEQAAIAKKAGYITGDFLKPNENLTREEAAVLITKVLKLEASQDQKVVNFLDTEAVSAEAMDAISILAAKGYVQGYNDRFYPKKGITRAEVMTILDKAVNQLYIAGGIYTSNEALGNVVVRTGDVTLKNLVINGNLYLAEGIGQGNVTLNNVTVKGKTFANGGGENSIILENTSLGAIVIQKWDGKIRIVAKGSTTVADVQLNSGAKLQEEGNTGSGFGNIEVVEIAEGQQIVLDGDFELVSLEVPGVSVLVTEGTIGNLNISEKASGTDIQLAQGAKVSTLTADAPVNVSGLGLITTANINAQNVSIETRPANTVIASGIAAVIGGTIQTGTSSSSSDGSGSTPPPPMWTMVWNDEFDGTTVNTSKWRLEDKGDGFGNDEAQYYSPSNAEVEDGKLIIHAKKESMGGKEYTSAKLFSKADWKYGKFEARIKLPEGQGFWPAFWMMPAHDVYGGWAASGEIDIMEAKGRFPDASSGAIHYGAPWPNNKFTGKEQTFPNGGTISQFHTYAVEWEPGEIRWYVDGNLFQTQNNWSTTGLSVDEKYSFPAPFDQNFYLMLNLAIGGTFDGGRLPDDSMFPTTMEVDYVRVYELTGRPYKTPVEPSITAEPLPEGARLADETGNLVKDVNFSQGINDNAEGLDENFGETWNFVHNAVFGGVATATVEAIDGVNYARINVTNVGSQPYSVQLEQLTTLGKGRWYKFSFDAKADKTRTLAASLGAGPTGGWAKYSDSYNVNLTTTMQHYEYTFQMTRDSDILTRIEYNCATDTGSVWIGNVRVEEVAPPTVDYNATKEPLPTSGNHIYNGAFDKYTVDRMAYWNVVKANATANVSVPENTRELTADISNGGASENDLTIDQKGVKLVSGSDYSLSFKARASAERTIKIRLTSKDGNTVYHEQDETLTTQNQTFNIPFTMIGATDPESVLAFHLGGNNSDVFIDDVSLIVTTKDYTNVDLYPLKNGDFGLGLFKWEPFTQGAAATFSNVDGEAKAAVTNVGSQEWNVMLFQGNMKFSKGMEYVLSFDARASVPRDISLTLENASYARRFQVASIPLTTQTQHFAYSFNITSDEVLSLKYLLGKTTNAVAGDIFIDNIVLEVKDAPESRPPTIQPDTTENKVGQPMNLIFVDDSAWRGAITEVSVDGSVLTPGQYTVTAGQLSIDSAIFTTAKSYDVTVKATGYAHTIAAQDVLPNDGNVVLNGDMSLNTQNWSIWTGDGAVAQLNVVDGEAKIDISNKGPNNWSVQFFQDGVQIQSGKTYQLSLKASSTIDRPIQVEFTGYNGNESVKFNVNATPTIYKYDLSVPGADSTFKLNFLIGNVTNGTSTTTPDAHTLIIDDVSIKEVTIQNAPVLTADSTQNYLTQNVDITFADDAAWRAAINAVKLDGITLVPSAWSVSSGILSINADQFALAKDYTITVVAPGYLNTQVTQTIVVDPASTTPPILTPDPAVILGQDATITFADDSNWRGTISSVLVNGIDVSAPKYAISAGVITIAQDQFNASGDYTITIKATGYDDATLTQTVWQEVGENLITDGTFSVTADFNGLWKLHNQGLYEQWAGKADFSISSGVVLASVIWVGWDWWQIQLYQDAITVPAGTYVISFDISSEAARPIYVELTGGAPRVTFNVDNSMKTYAAIINVTTEGVFKFMFGLGRGTEDPTLTVPYQIQIDNVKLIKITK